MPRPKKHAHTIKDAYFPTIDKSDNWIILMSHKFTIITVYNLLHCGRFRPRRNALGGTGCFYGSALIEWAEAWE